MPKFTHNFLPHHKGDWTKGILSDVIGHSLISQKKQPAVKPIAFNDECMGALRSVFHIQLTKPAGKMTFRRVNPAKLRNRLNALFGQNI